VFHAARQDLKIFYHITGDLPSPIFDTQVAAMVCGFGDQVSYEKLAGRLAGARIDKSSRFADWTRRPLTPKLLNYALSDVTHLRKVYGKLTRKLERSGRAGWLDEEMAVLTDPATYDLDPARAWLRLKTRSRDRRYLAVLREIATWRESEAQRRDVPRNRVIRDEQLYDIASNAPDTTEALARTRGLNMDFARGRLGQGLLKAVKSALQLPPEALPEAPLRDDSESAPGPLIELLKVLLKMKCEEHDVAQKLLASTADLERIALDDDAEVPALHGWRREVFGEDALALKQGRLALAAKGNRLKLVRLDAELETA
jgi:ribonuclease D